MGALKVGCRIYIPDKELKGTVQYIGFTDFAPGKWIGINLDEPIENHNETSSQAKEYFKCKENHGLFIQKIFFVVLDNNDTPIREYNSSHRRNLYGKKAGISQLTTKLSSPDVNTADTDNAEGSANETSLLEEELENLKKEKEDLTEKRAKLEVQILEVEEKLKKKKIQSNETSESKSKITDAKQASLQNDLELIKNEESDKNGDDDDGNELKILDSEIKSDFTKFFGKSERDDSIVGKYFISKCPAIGIIEVKVSIENSKNEVIGEMALSVILTRNATMKKFLVRVMYDIYDLHKFTNQLSIYDITISKSDHETSILSMEEEEQMKYIREQTYCAFKTELGKNRPVLKIYSRIIGKIRRPRFLWFFRLGWRNLHTFAQRASEPRNYCRNTNEWMNCFEQDRRPYASLLGISVMRIKRRIYLPEVQRYSVMKKEEEEFAPWLRR